MEYVWGKDQDAEQDRAVGIKLNPPFSKMDWANGDHAGALSAVFDKAQEWGVPVQLHTQTPMDPPLTPTAFANLIKIIADPPMSKCPAPIAVGA